MLEVIIFYTHNDFFVCNVFGKINLTSHITKYNINNTISIVSRNINIP